MKNMQKLYMHLQYYYILPVDYIHDKIVHLPLCLFLNGGGMSQQLHDNIRMMNLLFGGVFYALRFWH